MNFSHFFILILSFHKAPRKAFFLAWIFQTRNFQEFSTISSENSIFSSNISTFFLNLAFLTLFSIFFSPLLVRTYWAIFHFASLVMRYDKDEDKNFQIMTAIFCTTWDLKFIYSFDHFSNEQRKKISLQYILCREWKSLIEAWRLHPCRYI